MEDTNNDALQVPTARTERSGGDAKPFEYDIMGVRLHLGYTMETAVTQIRTFLQEKKRGIISTTNPEFIVDSQNDPAFKDIINTSLLSLPDGLGIVFAYEYQELVKKFNGRPSFIRYPLYLLFLLYVYLTFLTGHARKSDRVRKIPGVDLMVELCRMSEAQNYVIALVGGWPVNAFGRKLDTNHDLAQIVQSNLKVQFPNLRIVFASSHVRAEKREDDGIVAKLKQSLKDNDVDHIDILFVSFGHSKQEKWLVRNMDKIPANIGIGVGGAFNYLSNQNARPPKYMINHGFEWLFRLITNPFRVKRIFKAVIIFPFKLYRYNVKMMPQNTS